jgi:hypothetical protein
MLGYFLINNMLSLIDIFKVFKCRLKLSPEQAKQIVEFAGANRFESRLFKKELS